MNAIFSMRGLVPPIAGVPRQQTLSLNKPVRIALINSRKLQFFPAGQASSLIAANHAARDFRMAANSLQPTFSETARPSQPNKERNIND